MSVSDDGCAAGQQSADFSCSVVPFIEFLFDTDYEMHCKNTDNKYKYGLRSQSKLDKLHMT